MPKARTRNATAAPEKDPYLDWERELDQVRAAIEDGPDDVPVELTARESELEERIATTVPGGLPGIGAVLRLVAVHQTYGPGPLQETGVRTALAAVERLSSRADAGQSAQHKL